MSADRDLAALRSEIDALDDAILDLMEKRLALARLTAGAKTGADRLHIRPGREAAVIARLKARAGTIDPQIVEIIWRELIGLGRQAQAPLALVLHAPGERALFEAQARRHFGSVTPLSWADSAADALERARVEAVVAVLGEQPDALSPGLVLFDRVRDLDGEIVAYAVGCVASDDKADVPA